MKQKRNYLALAALGVMALSLSALAADRLAYPHPSVLAEQCAVQVLTSEERIRNAEDTANAATSNKIGALIEALAALDQHQRGLLQPWAVETVQEKQP